jgi:hypothetical protein
MTRETYTTQWELDLYRDDDGILRRGDDDEPFPAFPGLDAITHDEPARVLVDVRVYETREPRTHEYPGYFSAEHELLDMALDLGYGDTRRKIRLPEAAQDAIFDLLTEDLL